MDGLICFPLGVILYRMLTGHRPFQGNSVLTVALRVQKHAPVPAGVFNRELSPELDRVVARAIAKNPAERYQTGMEMVFDLQRLRDGIDSENPGEVVLPTPDTRANETPESSDVSYLLKTTNAFLSGSRNRVRAAKTAAPVHLDQPWQQLGVAFLTWERWLWYLWVLSLGDSSRGCCGGCRISIPSSSHGEYGHGS